MVKNKKLYEVGKRVLAISIYGNMDYFMWSDIPMINIDEEYSLRMGISGYIFKGFDFTKKSNGISTRKLYHEEIKELKKQIQYYPLAGERVVKQKIEGNIGWYLVRIYSQYEILDLQRKENKP
jgi:hypothetical protein